MPDNFPDRHSIRLRGPWWRSLGPTFDDGSAVRFQWPAATGPASTGPAASTQTNSGEISNQQLVTDFVLRRSFRKPSGLTQTHRIYLVVEGVENVRAMEINGDRVWKCDSDSSPALIEVDITQQVTAANRLDLIFSLPCPALPRIGGAVRLEIAHPKHHPS